MLSVVIATEGVEQTAVATLAALVPGAAAGVVREVLLVDRAGAGGRRPAGPLAMADVPACRRRAGPGLDRRDRAIYPAGLDQRQTPRRNLPLRPLALFGHPTARRLQIHCADDHRAFGRTGPA